MVSWSKRMSSLHAEYLKARRDKLDTFPASRRGMSLGQDHHWFACRCPYEIRIRTDLPGLVPRTINEIRTAKTARGSEPDQVRKPPGGNLMSRGPS